jgi:hypothetical protein
LPNSWSGLGACLALFGSFGSGPCHLQDRRRRARCGAGEVKIIFYVTEPATVGTWEIKKRRKKKEKEKKRE